MEYASTHRLMPATDVCRSRDVVAVNMRALAKNLQNKWQSKNTPSNRSRQEHQGGSHAHCRSALRFKDGTTEHHRLHSGCLPYLFDRWNGPGQKSCCASPTQHEHITHGTLDSPGALVTFHN